MTDWLAAMLAAMRDCARLRAGRQPRLLVNAGAAGAAEAVRAVGAAGDPPAGTMARGAGGQGAHSGDCFRGLPFGGRGGGGAGGGADMALLSPVFATESHPEARPLGLEVLAAACQTAGKMPVYALGGVNLTNAASCIEAGAAGVAGIRMFLGEDWKPLKKEEAPG